MCSIYKSTLCFVFIAYCFAPSRQNSIHDPCQNGDLTCTILHHPLPQNPFRNTYPFTSRMDNNVDKMPYLFAKSMKNNSAPGMTIMTMDKSRTGYYPNANGYGYHNIGQLSMPISHYPAGWPYPTFQGHITDGVRFRAAEVGDNFKPSPYPQYLSAVPRVHSMYPQPYQYSTPAMSVFYRSPSYPAYLSHFRNTNDDKFVPFTVDKRFPSMTPGYFIDNRVHSGSERSAAGSRMMQPILPWSINYIPKGEPNLSKNPVKNTIKDTTFKIIPSSFGYTTIKSLQQREASSYSNNRPGQTITDYSHVPLSGIPHTPLFPVPQLYRTVKEPKPSQPIFLPKNMVGAIFSSRYDSGRHIM